MDGIHARRGFSSPHNKSASTVDLLDKLPTLIEKFHTHAFKEKPAPMPVAILGISSDSTPRYSEKARRMLSAQLRGLPSGKFGGRFRKISRSSLLKLSYP